MRERYHCKPGTNTWHSETRCSHYPRLDYWSRSKLPTGGELCGECRQLQRAARPAWRDSVARTLEPSRLKFVGNDDARHAAEASRL